MLSFSSAQHPGKWMTGLSFGKSGRFFWDNEELGIEGKGELQYLVPNHQWIWNLAVSAGSVWYQEDRYQIGFATEKGNPWNAYYFDGVYVEAVLPRTQTRYLDAQIETQFHPVGRWFFRNNGWLSPFLSAGVGVLGHHIAVNALNGNIPYHFSESIPFRDFELRSNTLAGFLLPYDPPQKIIPAPPPVRWDNSYESAATGYSREQWIWHYRYHISFSVGAGSKVRLNDKLHLQAAVRLNGTQQRKEPYSYYEPIRTRPVYEHFRYHWSTVLGIVRQIGQS